MVTDWFSHRLDKPWAARNQAGGLTLSNLELATHNEPESLLNIPRWLPFSRLLDPRGEATTAGTACSQSPRLCEERS